MNLKRARETAGGDLWMSFARELMSSKIFKEKDNVKWYGKSNVRVQNNMDLIPRQFEETR